MENGIKQVNKLTEGNVEEQLSREKQKIKKTARLAYKLVYSSINQHLKALDCEA